ncbi:hypothetical protein VUR80DRAFT_2719 [Thermomyces stellatus]
MSVSTIIETARKGSFWRFIFLLAYILFRLLRIVFFLSALVAFVLAALAIVDLFEKYGKPVVMKLLWKLWIGFWLVIAAILTVVFYPFQLLGSLAPSFMGMDSAATPDTPVPGNWPSAESITPICPAEAGSPIAVVDLLADIRRCRWSAVVKTRAAAAAFWHGLPFNRPPPLQLPRAKIAENVLGEADREKLYELKNELRQVNIHYLSSCGDTAYLLSTLLVGLGLDPSQSLDVSLPLRIPFMIKGH